MKNKLACIVLAVCAFAFAGCSSTDNPDGSSFWGNAEKVAPLLQTIVATEVGEVIRGVEAEDPAKAAEIYALLESIEASLVVSHDSGIFSPDAIGSAIGVIVDELDLEPEEASVARRVTAYSTAFYSLYYDQLVAEGQFDDVDQLLEALINAIRGAQDKAPLAFDHG